MDWTRSRNWLASFMAGVTVLLASPVLGLNTVTAVLDAPPPAGGGAFSVSLVNSGPVSTISGFAIHVAFDDTQVTLTGVSDNTGQPAAGVEYYLGPRYSAALAPGTNAYVPVLMSTLYDVTDAGPVARLDFATLPTFTGTVRLFLEDHFSDPVDGLLGSDLENIPHGFSAPDPLVQAPGLTRLVPDRRRVNTGDFTLTVEGSNFVDGGSVVKWNGLARTTAFVSATTLTALIPASDLALSGVSTVTVENILPPGVSVGFPFQVLEEPAVVYVDDDWTGFRDDTLVVFAGAATNPHRIGFDAFSAIPDAHAAVASAGTVHVAPGDYPATVYLRKPLSLLGAQAGVAAPTRVASESVIRSAETSGSVQVESGGVTIDGFLLADSVTAVHVTGGPAAGLRLLNCIVAGTAGVTLEGFRLEGADGAVLEQDLVTTCGLGGIRIGAGGSMAATTCTVSGCGVGAEAAGAGALMNLEAGSLSANTTGVAVLAGAHAVMLRNLVHGGGEGITVAGPDSALLSSFDEVSSVSGVGIAVSEGAASVSDGRILDNATGILVSGNGDLTSLTRSMIAGNSGAGVEVALGTVMAVVNDITRNTTGVLVQAGAVPTTAGMVFNRIRINGNLAAGADNRSVLGELNALGVWWGDFSGPFQSATNPGGKGNLVSDRVNYDPWYDKGRFLNDRDGDGIRNAYEDYDLDNAWDADETRVTVRDTDADGVEDGIEKRAGFDPTSAASRPAGGDADGDLLPSSLDPDDNNPDLDGDRYRDGYEYAFYTDMNRAASRPKLGDASGNNILNAQDGTRTRQFLGGQAVPVVTDNMDMDRNGILNSADGTRLSRFLNGLQQLLP